MGGVWPIRKERGEELCCVEEISSALFKNCKFVQELWIVPEFCVKSRFGCSQIR